MDFFSDLGKKISDGAQTAVQKGKDFAEASKAQMAAKECETKMANIYKEIGKLYVQNRHEEAKANYPDFVAQLEQLEEEYKQHMGESREIKNQTVCQTCGRSVSKDAAFCPECGSKVILVEPASATAEASQVGKVCSNCGATLKEDARFCGACGTSV